jgi:hypothetical protein
VSKNKGFTTGVIGMETCTTPEIAQFALGDLTF